MNEILWMDVDNFPYTVRSTGDILGIKDRTYRCFLRTPIPMASRGDDRIYLHYLKEGQTFDSELWFEHDNNSDNFDD